MADIARFTLVQITSSSGGKPAISAWSPDAYEQPALTTANQTLGVTMTACNFGEPVAVMKRGYMRSVPGSSWSVGDSLWATSAGVVTKTRPAGPFPQVRIGTVYAVEGGDLYSVDVDVRVIPSLGELSGVALEAPANLDTFIYNSTTHCWTPRQIDHGGDIAGLLDDDHTQYLKERLSGGLESEVPGHSHQGTASASQLDHGAASTSASLLDNDHPLYQRKHGFDIGSDGSATQTITYSAATKKVTITPTGASFKFWIDGVQYIKSGAQVSGAHGTTTGGYFFYYNAAGLQVSAVNAAWSLRDRTVIPVAYVYWNNTLGDGVCFYECHTADRVLEMHFNLHFSRGCQYISGLDLSGYTPLTDSDAGVTFAIGSGVIADEDIRFAVGATADGGPYAIFYRTGGTGDWTWTTTDTFPFKNGGTYPQRNDPDGGGAGVWGLTEVGSAVGRYVNYFVCATTAVTPAAASAFLIPGQADHASLAAAQAEGIQSLSLGTLPFEEITPIWKITLLCRSTLGGTYNCRIEQVTSLKNQTVTIASSATGLVWSDLLSDQAILANRVFGG